MCHLSLTLLCVFGCLLKHRLDVNIFYIDITLWRVLTECSSSWVFCAFLPCLKKSVSVHLQLHSHIICCVYIQFFRILLCCWEHFGTHALIACSLSDNLICGSLFHGRYNIVGCDIDTSQLGHWHQSVVTLSDWHHDSQFFVTSAAKPEPCAFFCFPQIFDKKEKSKNEKEKVCISAFIIFGAGANSFFIWNRPVHYGSGKFWPKFFPFFCHLHLY